MLKLYGHYGSQPTRSVAWLLKIKQTPFEFVKVNPTSGETRTPEFRRKFPLGLVPALEDACEAPPFALSEASAILVYLCEKHGWDDFYPNSRADRRRAKVHEYLSHHNESARAMTRKVIMPTTKWMFAGREARGVGSGASSLGVAHLSHGARDVEHAKATVRDVAKRFQHKFLVDENGSASSDYIVEGQTPTIADLVAYPELAQIPMIMDIDYSEWPELEPLRAWMGKMSELPYHDDIHLTVYKIGKIYKSKL